MKIVAKKSMDWLIITSFVSVLIYYMIVGCINHQKLRFFIFAQQKLQHEKDRLSGLIKRDPCSVILQYESDLLGKTISSYQVKIDSAENSEDNPDY